jgi:DNA-binding MarR family transcriptional regulator
VGNDDDGGGAGRGSPADVERRFAYAVRSVGMAFLQYRATAARSAFGVGPSEGATLGELHLNGPLTPTELARRLGVSAPTMTDVLDRLERGRHVRRDPHPRDRRKVVVTISPETAMAAEREAPAFARLLAQALGGIDDQTRHVIVDVLDRASEVMHDVRQ